jgi:hypothetical protein
VTAQNPKTKRKKTRTLLSELNWFERLIPGRPKPDPAGYLKAVTVAVLSLDSCHGAFSRRLEGVDTQGRTFTLLEPRSGFAPWHLYRPGDLIPGALMTFTRHPASDRQFAIGQDVGGVRWWIVPADDDGQLWQLKAQAPVGGARHVGEAEQLQHQAHLRRFMMTKTITRVAALPRGYTPPRRGETIDNLIAEVLAEITTCNRKGAPG